MNPQTPVDVHGDGLIPVAETVRPSDLCDCPIVPTLPRQSHGSLPEALPLTSDPAMLPPVTQRKSPGLLEHSYIESSLKGKEKQWTAVRTAVTERKRPLQLLDLPLDILKEIIEKLPHTNDLTSLSLCHSVLHALTIPHIYSRFDIVWPDDTSTSVQRTGVDALTYGLATLVMAEENYGEAPWQTTQHCNPEFKDYLDPYPISRRRRGNYYAKYTKKFSLGNGPREWVQEYLISKEGGKMLGTLVALAVSRMRNLETFVWDMPTGVLRDVWLALSSLAGRGDGQECRLDKVWIRWHDNSALEGADSNLGPIPPPPITNVPPPPAIGSVPVLAAINMTAHSSTPSLQAIDRVEHPTFSVLPGLKSINVLDIDELPYLDEMSILIARSQHKLRELRVGIASQVQQRDWVGVWDGDSLQQVDYNTIRPIESRLGERRLGGILGILLGRVYNLRHNADTQRHSPSSSRSIRNSIDKNNNPAAQPVAPMISSDVSDSHAEVVEAPDDQQAQARTHVAVPVTAPEQTRAENDPIVVSSSDNASHSPQETQKAETPTSTGPWITGRPIPLRSSRRHGPYLNGKLKLETLELERVPLSVQMLQKAFDWTMLTKLTLLHCQDHEHLWKMLRRNYSPTSPYNAMQQTKTAGRVRLEYGLNLKQIHTNAVSPSLITFLKETLAPNSLEVLFLQEARSYSSTVTIDQIYRGPIKRHRASLQKLMIDSSEKGDDSFGSTRWRRWMLTSEIINYLSSGRMAALKEVGFALDYQDWHTFLQRLPNIAPLRSIYIPYIADHPHGTNIDPRDLALQVVDIVTLRPEIDICYMGIGNKCFEILENKPANTHLGSSLDHSSSDPYGAHDPSTSGYAHGHSGYAPIGGDGDVTDDEEVMEGEIEDDEDAAVAEVESEDELGEDWGDDDDVDDADWEGSVVGGSGKMRLRLREILFYDDKVAIFKARHGRL